MYSFNRSSKHHQKDAGQGLVEYALLLVMVAVVIIGLLSQLGTEITDTICQLTTVLQQGDEATVCAGVGINVIDASYDGSQVTIRATFNEGYDPTVSLSASPGGTFTQSGNEYSITFNASCPCNITVTASSGSSELVSLP